MNPATLFEGISSAYERGGRSGASFTGVLGWLPRAVGQDASLGLPALALPASVCQQLSLQPGDPVLWGCTTSSDVYLGTVVLCLPGQAPSACGALRVDADTATKVLAFVKEFDASVQRDAAIAAANGFAAAAKTRRVVFTAHDVPCDDEASEAASTDTPEAFVLPLPPALAKKAISFYYQIVSAVAKQDSKEALQLDPSSLGINLPRMVGAAVTGAYVAPGAVLSHTFRRALPLQAALQEVELTLRIVSVFPSAAKLLTVEPGVMVQPAPEVDNNSSKSAATHATDTGGILEEARVPHHVSITEVSSSSLPVRVLEYALSSQAEHSPPPGSRLVGVELPAATLHEVLALPFTHAATMLELGACSPSGVLLHGPPGTGKTALVYQAIADAVAATGIQLASDPASSGLTARLYLISGPELLSGYIGETEARLRAVFQAASSFAESSPHHLSVVFFDEIDALCPRRAVPGSTAAASIAAASPLLSRVVTQVLSLMDGAAASPGRGPGSSGCSTGRLVVIGATSRPDAIDPALRRPGRFDREARVDPPHAAARAQILVEHAKTLRLCPCATQRLPALAKAAIGYVGADLAALVREAGSAAVARTLGSLSQSSHTGTHTTAALACPCAAAASSGDATVLVCPLDFDAALLSVRASSLRGVSASTEQVAWADIGGMDGVVARLREAVEFPLLRGDVYRAVGLAPPRGVLLHGPPGNAKTTLVRALATATQAAFFALSGAEVYSPFLGEAEATIRAVFKRAREASPALVFMDEIDALVGSRGIGGTAAGADTSVGILATLLTEMDGVAGADGILVVGATNRLGALDPALLRPGRFDIHIHVPPPDAAGRVAVLSVHTRRIPLGPDVDLPALAAATPGWSGAQLENLCREAAMAAAKENIEAEAVWQRHFESALAQLKTIEV